MAKPALEEAEAALQTIKPAHVASVRKLQKPPHLIMRIMDCALILFRKRLDTVTIDTEKNCVKPSWSESLRLMSQSGFLQSLMTFPKVFSISYSSSIRLYKAFTGLLLSEDKGRFHECVWLHIHF